MNAYCGHSRNICRPKILNIFTIYGCFFLMLQIISAQFEYVLKNLKAFEL